jgi:hypothetical protein
VHLAGCFAPEAGENAVAYVSLFRLRSLGGPAGGAAARASGWLVLKAFTGVELLLACRKNESDAAILAVDFLIYVGQLVWNLLETGRDKPLRILRIEKRLAQAHGSRMTFDRIKHLQ